ncbi:carbon-phosphorus lyase complex subunit [Candidatus Propionivibrio aalborgensis]|jgi:alpha-D-ribose 1-methylphosphonate 5-phosphate C-P lyase|uniref:Alpha-D-ribose 1-methylphosphonate 5-phosphate C-P lyase n=1 Tax=Candidatus Propionivibrio aalborgensis TaxID=1860101 RepID=A0A1A8XP87_9RHOO|nr:alpha-D-ribose 1-methylphosphonate 5-phosphate C-P-lyase PhnJ [Candidatus Propionivibrio aalborgensis]MBK7326041.1 alpha-D-ribose 1-methylphosphonate 5-phosphate C-P-lyase PhnJ [Propionivibrio sp.]MBK7564824.1 alpha-D-ribose 1-methylphosphonate 5-phosphate C-P-lyase PhnJ [Propionivibrio sp.]MBP6421998.1 alpha-D-ribose 1-methylphosphonate 5-phosphate C-P-lyase PhnJ [Propionivibrio sp.]SBT05758.1 carbon-phosphorus lyase complex subunit [Candidatus Propionivibrio aalborgensis]HRC61080.1 alpha-
MIVTDNNSTANAYNFGFLDEYAKKEIRRAILKAIAIPGYQVPYASREMPMGRGFGTGGLQLTLSLIGPDEVVKVIDQGSDDSVNAVNLRQFIEMTCPGISTTTKTDESSLIQSRHRIPERPLTSQQIIVLQVPYPDPLVVVEPSEDKRKTMHGEADYSRLLVKLYEDIVAFDEITISHRYPTRINGHYVIDPSPIPRWDVPKLNDSAALILFGAGREKKIYAVPPHTRAEPLVFSDVPFRVEDFYDAAGRRRACTRCGCADSFLDEFVNESGSKSYQCSDSDWCDEQLLRVDEVEGEVA